MITEKAIQRRNSKLQHFFETYFPESIDCEVNIKIIGNKHAPAVIMDDRILLSCYAHNFDLFFTDVPKNGSTMHQEKLTWEMEPNQEAIKNWFHTAQHRPIYKIKVSGVSLYLAGYNFRHKSKENPEGKYPVFAPAGYKYYFTKEKAEEIVTTYSTEQMPLEVV